jgi:hypothetical protein
MEMAQVEHHDIAVEPTFQVGDMPGLGIYRCVQVPEVPEFIVHIENEDDLLPRCDKCDPQEAAAYRRVVDERSAVVDEQDQDPNAD